MSTASTASTVISPDSPICTPDTDPVQDGNIFDPIEAGIVDEDRAAALLDQFRNSFVLSFPFVVIPSSATVDILRRSQPFL